MDFENCKFERLDTVNLNETYFAEGVTRINNTLYMLTWRERKILLWDLKEGNKLELKEERTMPKNNRIMQGWGIAA